MDQCLNSPGTICKYAGCAALECLISRDRSEIVLPSPRFLCTYRVSQEIALSPIYTTAVKSLNIVATVYTYVPANVNPRGF
jgi:hypothetical protein